MKKLLYVSAGVMALSILCAQAQVGAPVGTPVKKERKQNVPPAPKVELKEMTFTGTISKQESKNKKDQVVVTYSMACDDGTTVKLPPGNRGLKLEDFVGVKVKLTGMGAEKDVHGLKTVMIHKITNIEKVTDQAPAAPAAPAPAPAK